MNSSTRFPDASHTLHGFRFQLLQSLGAWLALRPNEELWLEVSEDFSIHSALGEIMDAQVKASRAKGGATRYSLQSKDVRSALTRFWARKQNQADARLVFIAQGGAARENDYVFPESAAGLNYWHAAARGADTTSLRSALAKLFATEPLGQWIESNPTDEELRQALLARVIWALDASPIGELTEQLREQVTAVYLQKGLPAIAAREGWRALCDRVFDVACLPIATERRLIATDLHVMLEDVAATINLAKVMGAAEAGAAAPFVPALVSELAEPSTATAPRIGVVTNIERATRAEPAIWVHGAHGVGKSTLARLLARQFKGRWLVLDLRPAQRDSTSALMAWRELTRVIADDGIPDGIIFADIDGACVDVLSGRIAVLSLTIGQRGGRVILTSPRVPSPARIASLGASTTAVVHAPYFNDEDVRDLVSKAKPPPVERGNVWAAIVRMSAAGGHPLLVAAKVASLAARRWPREGLNEDIGRVSDAVRTTRDEARIALLRELSALDDVRSLDAGKMLRRLAIIFDRADEGLARVLAALPPAITTAGDALAVLRGSWLEVMPGGDLRVSPLLGDIASDVDLKDAQLWQRSAAEYWLKGGVLNERTLPLCFWNAFLGQHDEVLMKLCETLHKLRDDVLRGAAAFLAPIVALRTDCPIYPSNSVISTSLRLLQFQVADATESESAASEIAARLLLELNETANPDIRSLLTVVSAFKVLMALSVRLAPTTLVNYALRLRRNASEVARLGDDSLKRQQAEIEAQFGSDIDIAAFLFTGAISRSRTSEEFLKTIQALDAIDGDDRDSFLRASASIFDGISIFVSRGWAGDQVEGRDMTKALVAYEHAAAIAQMWQRPELMFELACAQSVIRDEGLNDVEGAITVIDTAIAQYGPVPALVRQKSKVLGHRGRDSEAVDLIITVEEAVGGQSLFDRTLALRDAGVSAARVRRFTDAVRLFDGALTAVRCDGKHDALAAGIAVDRAMALWEAGDRKGGLGGLVTAFEMLEVVDATASRQNERAHQFARGVGGLFFYDTHPYPIGPRPNIAYGGASVLSASEEPLVNAALKPLAENWRILALVEAECGFDLGVDGRSLVRIAQDGVATIESMISSARYCSAIKGTDVAAAVASGARAAVVARNCHAAIAGMGEIARVDIDRLYSAPVAELIGDAVWGEALRGVPVDILIFRRLSGVWASDLVDALRRSCATAFGSDAVADGLLKSATGRYAIGPAAPFTYSVSAAASRAEEQLATDPALRFNRDMIFVGHTAQSLGRRAIEPLLVSVIERGWRFVLDRQRFQLHEPTRHCTEIDAAVADMQRDGMRAAARLLLAAAPAVGVELSADWDRALRRVARSTADGT